MKQTRTIGALVLISLLTIGCSESGRMSDLAERVVQSQNDVNSNLAKANDNFVDLNRKLQQEREGLQTERLKLNEQFERLDQDRRDLHRQRRAEVVWSESLRFLAIVIAAIMPLFLCAYLIWTASQRSVEQEEVNSILLQELASPNPRLIVAPNLPAIEYRQNGEEGSSENSEPNKRGRKKRVTRRKD